MKHLYGKFVWFEHMSNDIPKAQAFYESLFGWQTESMPAGAQTYRMIKNGDQGIGGLRSVMPGVSNGWISYVSVADVDATYAAALKAGAKGLMSPEDFGPMGRGATIADPGGALLSLWKGNQDDRADVDKTAVGDWHWNELWATDDKAALAFYEGVLGYTHESMDMGPQGTYHVLKTGDKMRGGLVAQPKGPPIWLPYVAVDNCDTTTAKALELGAESVVMPPTDIANVGRFSIVLDPLGAAIAFIKPA